MPRLIVKCGFPGVLRLMYPRLRTEKKVPMRDGFFLQKDISYNESIGLGMYQEFVIVSGAYFEVEWGREDIVEEIRKLKKWKRRPKEFDQLTDEEFDQRAKVFMLIGHWPYDEESESMFELFRMVDRPQRIQEYIKLSETFHPKAIMYALLTFVGKSVGLENSDGVSSGYYRVLSSKKRTLTKNFRRALNTYSKYDKDMDEWMRVMRFVHDLGVVK